MDTITNKELYYDVVGRTRTTRYFTLSAVVIFVWDWATHFDDEVMLVWMRDWTLAGKPLYLFLRYVGLVFQVYDLVSMMGIWGEKVCSIYFWALAIGTALFLYLVDILLAYRVVCLFHQRFRLLLIINLAMLLTCAAASIVILSYALPLYEPIPTPEHLTGCWAAPNFEFASLIPPIVFELWIFILGLYKIYLYWREYNGVPKVFVMVKMLIRDQVSWFFVISGVILWSCLQLAVAPTGLRAIALPFFRSFVCICGCRLVLHIRKSYYSHCATGEEIVSEAHGIVRDYAPKLGLPPLPRHFQRLWPDNQVEEAFDKPLNIRLSTIRRAIRPQVGQENPKGPFITDGDEVEMSVTR